MIETITISIAALGMLMVLILYSRIHNVNAELKLKKYHSKDAGMADLLNYAAMVDDGVIVGKNGSFMASWLYQGDDNASSTDEQREMCRFASTRRYRVSAMAGWCILMRCADPLRTTRKRVSLIFPMLCQPLLMRKGGGSSRVWGPYTRAISY